MEAVEIMHVSPSLDATSEEDDPWWAYLLVIASVVVLVHVYWVWKADKELRKDREEKRLVERKREYSRRHPPRPDRVFTKTELAYYSGADPTSPIYLSCKGMVYDVTAGECYYGPDAAYGHLAGTDGSRSLARMDVKERGTTLDGLTALELQTLDEWEELFMDKYPRVGILSGWSPHGDGGSPPPPVPERPAAKRNQKGGPAAAAPIPVPAPGPGT